MKTSPLDIRMECERCENCMVGAVSIPLIYGVQHPRWVNKGNNEKSSLFKGISDILRGHIFRRGNLLNTFLKALQKERTGEVD